MAFEAPAIPLHDLPCSPSAARKRAAGQPSLSAVAARAAQISLMPRKPQFAEHQLDAGGVDLVDRVHAAAPMFVAIWS